jgi:hypothetical protein
MILLLSYFVPLTIPGLPSSDLITLLYIASFVVLTLVSLLFATRIQASMMLGEIGRNLVKFEAFKNNSRRELLNYLTANCNVTFSDAEREVDRITEYFTIMPENIDPAGVVGKMEQVVRLQDDRMRQEIKEFAPSADSVQQSIAQNMLEVASTLSQIYKLMRHYYLMGQKMKNPYILAQAQMSMPILLKMAEAYYGGIEAYKLVQPIGDGIGEMVAGRLMLGKEKLTIARETVYAKTEYKGRTLLVVKAQGPMATVGMLDVAIQKLTEDPSSKTNMLIMIDAASKLEGEKTGEIAQGIGAAIGGIGTEKFRIEEAATKNKIPMYAIVVKESLVDTIGVMTKEISESSEKVVQVIQNLIEKKTKESDTILIIGVGNTLGIGQ